MKRYAALAGINLAVVLGVVRAEKPVAKVDWADVKPSSRGTNAPHSRIGKKTDPGPLPSARDASKLPTSAQSAPVAPPVDDRVVRFRPLVVPNCQIKLLEEVEVPAETAGVLVEMRVKEGDVVQTGDVLAKLNDKISKLEVELKERSAANKSPLEVAKQKLALARQEERAGEKLFKSGNFSPEEYTKRRVQAELSEEDVKNEEVKLDQADAEHEKAEVQLGQHLIRSPLAGKVQLRLKHSGEAVQALETVFHIVRTERVKVEAVLELGYKDKVQQGMQVEVLPDVPSGELDRASHNTAIFAVRVLPDNRHFAYGCEDGTVTIWSLTRHSRVRVLHASTKPIRCLAATGSETNSLITGGDEGVLRFWNLKDGSEYREAVHASENGDSPITALAIDPADPNLGYTGHEDGRVHVWDWKEGKISRTLLGPSGAPAHVNRVTYLTLSPDHRTLLSVDDNSVRIWNLADGTSIAFNGRSAADKKDVRQLNFSPDGKECPYNSNGLLQLLRLPDGLPVSDWINPDHSFAHFAVFSPCSGLIATAQDDSQIQLWRRGIDGRPARLARVYQGHQKDMPIHQIDFASDGSFFVTCSADRTARVWEAPALAKLDAERLTATITYVSPQAEPGADKRIKFVAEVDNRKGLLTANSTATIIVYPQR